jgi:hypothetical protein
MAVCEVCGNDYELAFEVVAQGARHTFDSFECAIHRMAPICEHCGVKVVGHGVVVDGHSGLAPSVGGGRRPLCRVPPRAREWRGAEGSASRGEACRRGPALPVRG